MLVSEEKRGVEKSGVSYLLLYCVSLEFHEISDKMVEVQFNWPPWPFTGTSPFGVSCDAIIWGNRGGNLIENHRETFKYIV